MGHCGVMCVIQGLPSTRTRRKESFPRSRREVWSEERVVVRMRETWCMVRETSTVQFANGNLAFPIETFICGWSGGDAAVAQEREKVSETRFSTSRDAARGEMQRSASPSPFPKKKHHHL